jgi:hypothetical protein
MAYDVTDHHGVYKIGVRTCWTMQQIDQDQIVSDICGVGWLGTYTDESSRLRKRPE